MYAPVPSTTSPIPSFAPVAPAIAAAARREQHRARDFGVGYGNSSGYSSGKRYADNWGNARFRCS